MGTFPNNLVMFFLLFRMLFHGATSTKMDFRGSTKDYQTDSLRLRTIPSMKRTKLMLSSLWSYGMTVKGHPIETKFRKLRNSLQKPQRKLYLENMSTKL